ncbi:MAG: tRNA (adenosine(37)-N6)-threonylcarbamoyltransferase complex ATPase subunit type 1 TsaE [Candidatus Moranbacteria bacterium]|nr:tRNA (adenosine(37)-N6)-threonylcarbamoyltransferase complex ATPase subunit type 1 TsaE [Candidatus Moranbacteria bacterium]
MSIVKNLEEMENFSKNFLAEIDKKNMFCLFGQLGAGKTTFAKFLAFHLGIKKNIISPTFNILKVYEILKSKKKFPKYFYHIDCYRLNNSREIVDLGFKEWVNDSENLMVIEWADKIEEILPQQRIDIFFKHHRDLNKRIVEVVDLYKR